MAVAVRLLDRTTFRIGSETYADANGSFGLATIRKSDVTIDGTRLIFDYVGKGGARRVHDVHDPRITPLLGRMKRRRGGGVELLAYREDGRWRDVRSGDVNTYLKGLLGPDHSAKDFRTWHATVTAAVTLAAAEPARTATARRKRIREAVVAASELLGNTPTVARSAYVDPRVLDLYESGTVLDPVPRGTDAVDRAVAALLTQ